jgi:hypothetical protein
MKKLTRGQISGFFSKKRLKAPADVRTLPRPETIALCRIPVVMHGLEHFLAQWANRPALIVKTLIFSRRHREMVVHEYPAGTALFPDPGVAEVHFSSLTVL